jgi:hypothetical protein
MQKWEYKIFASHLDPAELVLILDECGRDGWELVALAAVTDYHRLKVLDPAGATEAASAHDADEVVPTEAFRYIFKRPLK